MLRVGLARMLARKPQLVLLDEPFTGLDRQLTRELIDALVFWNQTLGFTMIAVDHEAEVLRRLVRGRPLSLRMGRSCSAASGRIFIVPLRPRYCFTFGPTLMPVASATRCPDEVKGQQSLRRQSISLPIPKHNCAIAASSTRLPPRPCKARRSSSRLSMTFDARRIAGPP